MAGHSRSLGFVREGKMTLPALDETVNIIPKRRNRRMWSMIGQAGRAYMVVGMIWVAIQIPFLDSAFRVDEPLVLALATCLNSGCPRPAFLPWGFAGGFSEVFHVYVFR